ncbi:MAG: tRNA pseudouridine(55) synthase TruB [Lachnospiraceae bacterium]|nr:tRNA pseudouridine(55) synthase TruB [Candidatus Equihabitans merdae]
MINGIIIVNKEKGMTSFSVVSRLRRIFDQKKIGHTGTLDPDATGVLPCCFGKGTKVVDMLTNHTKTYEAVLHLGVTTDTQDMTGEVLSEREVCTTEEAVREAILSFEGDSYQMPPMYSAVKVNGQKLVNLARKGIEVERKPRLVSFSNITIKEIALPDIRFEVTCSKGAYIRTLCHDIGEKLGCGGAMASLLRVRVGEFSIDQAYTLSELEEMKKTMDPKDWPFVISIDAMFPEYPKVKAPSKKAEAKLLNGLSIYYKPKKEAPLYRVYTMDDEFIGLYAYNEERKWLHLEKSFYDYGDIT